MNRAVTRPGALHVALLVLVGGPDSANDHLKLSAEEISQVSRTRTSSVVQARSKALKRLK
jgi:hypothetical protein